MNQSIKILQDRIYANKQLIDSGENIILQRETKNNADRESIKMLQSESDDMIKAIAVMASVAGDMRQNAIFATA